MTDVNLHKKTGTREWSDSSINCFIGCAHNCLYCYARAGAARFNLRHPDEWHIMTPTTTVEKTFGKRKGVIMFPTTHDITPGTLPECKSVLRRMLTAGNRVLVVTKAHFSVIEALCKEFSQYKNSLEFRFSIGTLFDPISLFWEPNAPLPRERIEALHHAYSQGFSTSVSMEPMLDQNVKGTVLRVKPYVTESIWIGKMNNVRQRLCANNIPNMIQLSAMEKIAWQEDDEFILELVDHYKIDPIIKWKDSIMKVIAANTNEEVCDE